MGGNDDGFVPFFNPARAGATCCSCLGSGTADWWDRRLSILSFFLFTAGHLFEEVAELLFWDEFTSRFNFVAVDYLVYNEPK